MASADTVMAQLRDRHLKLYINVYDNYPRILTVSAPHSAEQDTVNIAGFPRGRWPFQRGRMTFSTCCGRLPFTGPRKAILQICTVFRYMHHNRAPAIAICCRYSTDYNPSVWVRLFFFLGDVVSIRFIHMIAHTRTHTYTRIYIYRERDIAIFGKQEVTIIYSLYNRIQPISTD